MNESFVTVVGNMVGDPQGRSTKTGKPFASFRVASTTRRWNAETRAFVDGNTNFVNVVAFNALGGNVMGSLKKGEPVVVYGRLRVNQWVREDGQHMTSVEVDAYSVGHDLNRGQTTLVRPGRVQYESNDRLADGNVQSSLNDAEFGDGEHEEEPDEVDSLVRGGFNREVEDAETDDYVAVSAVSA